MKRSAFPSSAAGRGECGDADPEHPAGDRVHDRAVAGAVVCEDRWTRMPKRRKEAIALGNKPAHLVFNPLAYRLRSEDDREQERACCWRNGSAASSAGAVSLKPPRRTVARS